MAKYASIGVAAVFFARTAAAFINIDIDDAIAAEDGTATIAVTYHANGETVAGVQNDIFFDTRVVRLESAASCKIDPGIGQSAPGCEEEPPQGPCKTLLKDLSSCSATPTRQGCEGQPADVWRFRAILVTLPGPSSPPIPDGAVLYRCKFTVVEPDALPALLNNENIYAGDTFGERVAAEGKDGSIALFSGTPPPTWTPRPTDARCEKDEDCSGELRCNLGEGGICCESAECQFGMSCGVSGHEGRCSTISTPTPTPSPYAPVTLYFAMDGVDAGGRLTVFETLEGDGVWGIQTYIYFDNQALHLVECSIDEGISDRDDDCELDPPVAPCKSLDDVIIHCPNGVDARCGGRSSEFDAYIGAIGSYRFYNNTTIPSGAGLLTCEFDVIDASRLPTSLSFDVAAADYQGKRIEIAVLPASEPGSLGQASLTVEAPATPLALRESDSGGCALTGERGGGRFNSLILAVVVCIFRGCIFRGRTAGSN